MYFFSPFSFEKNIWDAYDSHISLMPNDDDWAVLMDQDVCFLTHDAAEIIVENINLNPDISLFTCLTNRVACVDQLYEGDVSVDPNIYTHLKIARKLATEQRNVVQETNDPISGMVMILQKKVWKYISRKPGILGIDNHISQSVIDSGGLIGVMKGIYVFHVYRMSSRVSDRSHLL